MEGIVDVVIAFIAIMVEITVHALIFLYLLVFAIFSPNYRKRLKKKWDTSNRRRFTMVFGAVMYTAFLVIAILFWPAFFTANCENTKDVEAGEKIESILKKLKEMKEKE